MEKDLSLLHQDTKNSYGQLPSAPAQPTLAPRLNDLFFWGGTAVDSALQSLSGPHVLRLSGEGLQEHLPFLAPLWALLVSSDHLTPGLQQGACSIPQ